MDSGQADAIITRLNARAERMPGVYKLQVVAFSALGYAFYLFLLFGALSLVGGMVLLAVWWPSFWVFKLGWKVGIPVLLLAYAMVRALKVRTLDPEGLLLTKANAAKLFELVERLSQRLAVPPLEFVLLTDDYNAAAVQSPRYGFFGSRNGLLLGLPLLQSLSVDDITAVLAHELGHLSGNHGRFNGFLYRAVGSYLALLESTGENKLIERFLSWYVPRLSTLTFPLRRRNEYEADAASAEIVGTQRAGQALTNVHVRGALQPAFWKTIRRFALDSPHPPATLFLDWERQVQAEPITDAQKALELALAEKTGTTDTHPSLADRLQKLGVAAALEPPPTLNAARELLGASYASIAEQVGFRWSAKVHVDWKNQHDQAKLGRERLAALEKVAEERALSADEAFQRADLHEDLHPDADALPLFQAALALDPGHAGARFSVARLLLSRGDAAGVELMKSFENAPEPQLRFAASALLAGFYARSGDDDAAQASLNRAQGAHADELARARAREELKASDLFVSNGLGPSELEGLAEDFALFPSIKHAYVVKKTVPGDDAALFVIAIELKLTARAIDDPSLVQRVVDTVTLPGRSFCIRLDENPSFRRRILDVPGSLVFPREPS